jgi:hypothetical protein
MIFQRILFKSVKQFVTKSCDQIKQFDWFVWNIAENNNYRQKGPPLLRLFLASSTYSFLSAICEACFMHHMANSRHTDASSKFESI